MIFALADPSVVEVMLNADGELWVERLGSGVASLGETMSRSQAENLLGTVSLIEYHYDCPFKFTGKLDKLTYQLGPVQIPKEGQQALRKAAEAIAQGKD